jgi:hypothetical protein
MEYGTLNELAWGNVKNEMNDFTIVESFFFQIILHFISMSYSNTMIPQSQATMDKLKPLRLLLENQSSLERAKISLGIFGIVTLPNAAGSHDNVSPVS